MTCTLALAPAVSLGSTSFNPVTLNSAGLKGLWMQRVLLSLLKSGAKMTRAQMYFRPAGSAAGKAKAHCRVYSVILGAPML